jgi:hypothetical protein
MSRENRRRRESSDATEPITPEPQAPPPRRPLLRREQERVENAPGYASPAPWSVRGTLILFGLMVLINLPVAAVAARLDNTLTYWEAAVSPSVFLYLLYALLAMPWARRLAGEARSLRPLETISTAALSYLLYYLAATLVVRGTGGVDPHNATQLTELTFAALIGGAAGAALYPYVYRRFWMPRLPGTRR